MSLMQIIFILAALATLVAAVLVVSTRKILHAALWLVAALFGVAILFALLQASFFAVIQVVVYIGAIAILVIFAVMLTRRVMADTGPQVIRYWPLAAVLARGHFRRAGVAAGRSWSGLGAQAPALASDSASVAQLGLALVSPDGYMVPFEVASVLLLAALVGAIFVAYQRKEALEEDVMIPLSWYLIFAAALFCVGLFGVLARKNAIAILMGVELMLNAVNINLVAFWRYLVPARRMSGLAFVAIVFATAAAEVAVGLAIIISAYRRRNTVVADDVNLLKG